MCVSCIHLLKLLNTQGHAVNLTTGQGMHTPCAGNTGEIRRFGIPSFCLQDGPTGVVSPIINYLYVHTQSEYIFASQRPTDFASQFPSQVTVGATWDRDLIYQRAYAIGSEFRDKGVHVALAPVTGGPLTGEFADLYLKCQAWLGNRRSGAQAKP